MSVPEDEKLAILAVVTGQVNETEFVESFSYNPSERALHWLREGLTARDNLAIELALHLGLRFGLKAEMTPILKQLTTAGWHQRHEDVAEALGRLAQPGSEAALYTLATTEFDYRAYDDSQSLGRRCIRALERVATPEAASKLRDLVRGSDPILRHEAARALERIQPRGVG